MPINTVLPLIVQSQQTCFPRNAVVSGAEGKFIFVSEGVQLSVITIINSSWILLFAYLN